MPRTITFGSGAPLLAETADGTSHVAITGRKRDVVEALPALVGGQLPKPSLAVLTKMVAAASVSSFGGGAVTFTAPLSSGVFAHIQVLLIPDVVSRHNAATRPDALAKLAGQIRAPMAGGDDGEADSAQQAKRARSAAAGAAPVVQVAVLLPGVAATASEALGSAAAIARACPLYTRKGNKTETSGDIALDVHFFAAGKEVADKEVLARVSAAVDGVRLAASLVDTPCNELYTTEFARRAVAATKDLPHVSCKTIEGEALREQGLGGIYGVGKAALHPPVLVVLSYNPPGATNTIAWCGKGIVYDTGGLSIKTKTGMPGMKRDMGGAAGILGAFIAAAKTGCTSNIHAVLCLAENAVSDRATRPDDIHLFLSGKTVEVNNTDAEGRLVLGDGVAYAAKFLEPSVIVDMCTLTGAQGIATGKRHAAILTNDAALEAKAMAAGQACGDLVHPMPYCPEFFMKEFASEVADMKNSVKDRSNAQVSCAGHFIGSHIPDAFFETGSWLHIDMAAPAYSGERGTGYGVALLLELFAFGGSK